MRDRNAAKRWGWDLYRRKNANACVRPR